MTGRTSKAESPTPEDQIFKSKRERIDDFNFGRETAAVFDDMLNRSVPFYGEIQRMVGELASDFATPGSSIYDLGCSTCNSFWAVAHYLPEDLDVRFVGIDSSQEMLDKARSKLEAAKFPYPYELRRGDLHHGLALENASVVILCLTLQFVRPLFRDQLVASVYQGLNKNGCLLLVEKVLGEHTVFNRLFIKHYYEMKRRRGYSDLEISQKREALENVLVPYRLEENKELLRRAGFEHLNVFFHWYNFAALVALK